MRDEVADILDAAYRPTAGRLGSEAIRFSMRPELGGQAAVVEIVRRGAGHADVRLFTFWGHPRWRWEPRDEDHFLLPEAEYRRLAAQVDAALARYREPVPAWGNGEIIVCTDGPGFLTERVKASGVTSLAGQCPPAMDEGHPNRDIAALVDAMLCRHRGWSLGVAPFARRRCARR